MYDMQYTELATKMNMGERIKHRREELGFTQGELARLASVRRATISDIERGVQDMTTELAKKLAYHLRCSLDWLIGLYDPG
jgi:transcriptional regulator with XRE-family HTH domain